LISDKIKAGDSKREVMCIHFDHHQRKTTLVGVLHGRAVMVELELHGRPCWLAGEEREGEERSRGGHSWLHGEGEVGAMREVAYGGSSILLLASCSLLFYCLCVLCAGRRKEKKQKRKRRKGEK
jgi:hypothetical protein